MWITGTTSSGRTSNKRAPSPEPALPANPNSPSRSKQKEKAKATQDQTLKRKKGDQDDQMEQRQTEVAQQKAKRKGGAVMTDSSKLLPSMSKKQLTRSPASHACGCGRSQSVQCSYKTKGGIFS